jgi:hypothetical protein
MTPYSAVTTQEHVFTKLSDYSDQIYCTLLHTARDYNLLFIITHTLVSTATSLITVAL